MSAILVLGAGGHAKVVADIIVSGGAAVTGFLDDDAQTWNTLRLGIRVLGSIDSHKLYAPAALAMGIGSCLARQHIVQRLSHVSSLVWYNAIHPTAVVAASVRMGHGIVIAAGGIINPDATLGNFAIVNTGATVDHDCLVGDYAHLAPGTHLSGGVRVGEGVLIGVGASVAPGCSIGDWSVIGAGAAVVRDIPAHVTAKGVPARW